MPTFHCLSQPSFVCGEVDDSTFIAMIKEAYEEIVYWQRHLFKVHSGRAGKAFVSEVAHLLLAYAEAGALEAIALNAAMIIPALLLQKPSASSKAKDHTQCLDWQLKLRREGDISSLIQEGRAIQSCFSRNRQKTEAQTAHTFAKLMIESKQHYVMSLTKAVVGSYTWTVRLTRTEPTQ